MWEWRDIVPSIMPSKGDFPEADKQASCRLSDGCVQGLGYGRPTKHHRLGSCHLVGDILAMAKAVPGGTTHAPNPMRARGILLGRCTGKTVHVDPASTLFLFEFIVKYFKPTTKHREQRDRGPRIHHVDLTNAIMVLFASEKLLRQ